MPPATVLAATVDSALATAPNSAVIAASLVLGFIVPSSLYSTPDPSARWCSTTTSAGRGNYPLFCCGLAASVRARLPWPRGLCPPPASLAIAPPTVGSATAAVSTIGTDRVDARARLHRSIRFVMRSLDVKVFGGRYDHLTVRTIVEGHLRVGQGPAAIAQNVAAVLDARAVGRGSGRTPPSVYVARVTPLSNSPQDVMLRRMEIKVKTPDHGPFALASCRHWVCARCTERLGKVREKRRPTRDEESTPFSYTELHPESECARAWRVPEIDEASRAEWAARRAAKAIKHRGTPGLQQDLSFFLAV